MNDSHKQLKVSLMLGIRKLVLVFVASKLGEFPICNNFFDFSPFDFLDLGNFRDLANFWPFDFPDFLVYSSLSNLSTSQFLLSFPEASLLSLFLPEANLLPLF